MGNVAHGLAHRRFPWFNLRRLVIGLIAIALLIAFLFPNAHRVTQLVTIASVIGAVAATLCGLTFWPKARVRMARFLNARNLKFQYKVVRRNAAAVAVVGLSFLLVRAVAGGPTDAAKAFNERGAVHLEKREYDRAIQDFDRAIKLNPKSADALTYRAEAYRLNGDYDRAIQGFDQAIKLDPKSADHFNGRGVAYSYKGEYDRAIKDFDQAIKLDPNKTSVFVNRGAAYDSKGDHDRAIQDYDQAIKLDPKSPKNAEAFYNRGFWYGSKGEFDRAIQDYDHAIKLDPKDADAIAALRLAYVQKKPSCPPH